MGKILLESSNAEVLSFGVDSFDRPTGDNQFQNYAFIRFNILDKDNNIIAKIRKVYAVGEIRNEKGGASQAFEDFATSKSFLKSQVIAIINEYKGV